MVITSRTYTTLFATADTTSTSGELIRLPLSVVPHYERRCEITGEIVPTSNKPLFRSNLWSSDEHERFLHGLELFPNGPWKEVAKIVGTKSTRQTMTHAQKYRQKIERRMQAKAKDPKDKSSRRSSASTSNCSRMRHGASATPPMTMMFFDEQVSCHELEDIRPKYSTASPMDVHSDVFGSNFLDHEFETLLTSLEPLCRLTVQESNPQYNTLS